MRIWFSSGCCKATADQLHITMPFMPLLKLAICFQCDAPKNFLRWICISAHEEVLMNFATKHKTVSTERARAGVRGCGGSLRGTRRARTMGIGRPPLSPRKKIWPAQCRASTSCEVSLEWVRNERMENVRGTQGMTISERKQLKKIMECVSAKMAVSKSKTPFYFFNWVCFCSRPCAYFFQVL